MAYYIKELARNYQIGVFLNLDHMTKAHMELIEAAIEEEITSPIMIDASKESFEDNVRISREVAELAHQRGILVEAELEVIKGVEDEIVSEEAFYTAPDEAKDIKLRLDITARVDRALQEQGFQIPLVLQGTSEILPGQVRRVIGYGVCKLMIDST